MPNWCNNDYKSEYKLIIMTIQVRVYASYKLIMQVNTNYSDNKLIIATIRMNASRK